MYAYTIFVNLVEGIAAYMIPLIDDIDRPACCSQFPSKRGASESASYDQNSSHPSPARLVPDAKNLRFARTEVDPIAWTGIGVT
jgi:hypothetical protein